MKCDPNNTCSDAMSTVSRSVCACTGLAFMLLIFSGCGEHEESSANSGIVTEKGKDVLSEPRVTSSVSNENEAMPPTVQAVLKKIRGKDLWALMGAIETAKKAHTLKKAVPGLTEALDDPDGSVRYLAVIALGEIGPNAISALPQLVKSLNDEDPLVRSNVAAVMLDIGPESIPFIIGAFKHPEKRVRLGAVHALAEISAEDAQVVVRPLATLLKDDYFAVRASSARLLGRIGPPAKSAVPALIEAGGF